MIKQWAFVIRLLLLVIVLIGVFWLLNRLSWLVTLLLISILIVYTLHPLLDFIKKRYRVNHGLATILVFLSFILFIVISLSLVIPVVYIEALELAENFPQYLIRLQGYITWTSQQVVQLDIADDVRSILINISDNLHQAVEYLAEASISLIGGTIDFFLILFLVFYLLHDFESVKLKILSIVPTAHKAIAKELINIVDTNVGVFIRGSIIRCSIVAVITGIILVIIGMPYALLLALIAGLFNFILYIGPYIAAVPALLLSLSPQTPSFLLVAIIYIAVQLFDGMFLAPVVLGRTVKLKPITIITAILAGGSLAGLLGMVLAVPIAGIINSILVLIKQGPAYQGDLNQ